MRATTLCLFSDVIVALAGWFTSHLHLRGPVYPQRYSWGKLLMGFTDYWFWRQSPVRLTDNLGFTDNLYVEGIHLLTTLMFRELVYPQRYGSRIGSLTTLLLKTLLLLQLLRWGAADDEIKFPSVEHTELKRSPFKAWSRSVYSHTCYAYCQGFLPC